MHKLYLVLKFTQKSLLGSEINTQKIYCMLSFYLFIVPLMNPLNDNA